MTENTQQENEGAELPPTLAERGRALLQAASHYSLLRDTPPDLSEYVDQWRIYQYMDGSTPMPRGISTGAADHSLTVIDKGRHREQDLELIVWLHNNAELLFEALEQAPPKTVYPKPGRTRKPGDYDTIIDVEYIEFVDDHETVKAIIEMTGDGTWGQMREPDSNYFEGGGVGVTFNGGEDFSGTLANGEIFGRFVVRERNDSKGFGKCWTQHDSPFPPPGSSVW